MNFIEPLLLWGLPLASLPIIIHLINQRRYQTVRWGAMMFLLAANRLSRGYARLRQWLIMLFRILAIAALIFTIARPLATGFLGLKVGGRPDTTIVLLDRSPSMQETGGGAGGSKLETGRQQLVQALTLLGSTHWVLVDSTTNQAVDLESPGALLNSRAGEPASAGSDLTSMLQTAYEYIKTNKTGRTEIWICSDLRDSDWQAEGGRWQSLRESFLEFPQGVRFHLLAYPQTTPENMSVRVTSVRRVQTSDAAELVISLKLSRATPAESRLAVPVQFEIDGARSEFTVDFEGLDFELKDHRIPIERSRERGWGRVSIPADANPADNEYCFVFDRPVPRKAVVLADESTAGHPLQLAASISPDPSVPVSAETISEEQLPALDWDNLSLLIWQAPLPAGTSAQLVQTFVERGGQVIFCPPRGGGDTEIFGVSWKNWMESPDEIPVEQWRGDQDLLAHTNSGAALPVGKLQIRKHRELTGEFTVLASLRGGQPLLARATTSRGGAYFLTTTPAPTDSSLASDGIVMYVMVQRALAAGAAVLGNTRQLVAGPSTVGDPVQWQKITGDDKAISIEYPYHRGVYATGEKLLAVNRSEAEDNSTVVPDPKVKELFQGLDFSRVDHKAGNTASVIREIWRLFLAAMIIALIVEAGLCLPKVLSRAETGPKVATSGFTSV
ncbi:MAG: BatA domain-containing protein [Planctomycetes bacterium]|nr:BatA domain-containing protein [Planctomycetota bacterium]